MITAMCHVIMYRLNLVQEQDYCMGLSISKETTKRSTLMCKFKTYNYNPYIYIDPIIPKHIPSLCTVLQYFKHCADIRGVLKKVTVFIMCIVFTCDDVFQATLLGLSQYCVNDADRTRLQWLSSREGQVSPTHCEGQCTSLLAVY